jgi:hypothetical protein
MESEEGKKLTIASEMNELAYSEQIFSIDDKKKLGKQYLIYVKASWINIMQMEMQVYLGRG